MRDEGSDASVEVGQRVVERGGPAGLDGVGIDQCHQLGSGSSSSCARSHTVTTCVPSGISPTRRGTASPRDRPARRAAANAPRWTRGAGCVPADSAGRWVRAIHSAAASCERAELWLHRNSTAPLGKVPRTSSRASGSRTSRTYLRRPSPADTNRTISPTSSSTVRWCASRFDGMSSRSPSSFGDRSLTASSSTIASRAGSPSAACIAARVVMSSLIG